MLGLTTTRRLNRELALARELTERARTQRDNLREARDTAVYNREQILRQLAAADTANRRLHGRNLELGRRLAACGEADPEYAASLERRLGIARRAAARILTALHAETRRADHLQGRLDDLLGLNRPPVKAGADWQKRRDDKDLTKEVQS